LRNKHAKFHPDPIGNDGALEEEEAQQKEDEYSDQYLVPKYEIYLIRR